MSFHGRTIIVTGATSGIGRATAEAFGRERASVVVVGRQEADVAASAEAVTSQGGRAVGKSDAIGAYPAENAVEPSQVVATIYKSLGFHFDTALPGPNGRPFPLVDFGKQEIKELF